MADGVNGHARSFDEARLYMELRPCDCGETQLDSESSSGSSGGERVRTYTGICPRCGRRRSFSFSMPAEMPPLHVDIQYGPDQEPSRLIDAGEWLVVSDAFSDNARLVLSADQLSGDDLTTAHYLLLSAIAATEEVMKFIPDGADEVPAAAFWTEHGQSIRRAARERFRAEELSRALADRRGDMTDFESRVLELGAAADGAE